MRKTFILLPFLMAVCLLLQAQPGALDTGFPAVPQAGLSNGSFQPIVRTVLEQPDGKLLLGGNFDAYNGVARNGVLRLNADGSLDEAYHPVFEEVLPAGKLVLQTDGKLWVARQQPISATTSQCLMRLMPNGSIDGSFSCGTGFSLNNFSSGIINALLLQPDGKLVVGGMFDSYNGVNEHNIIRLNADGTIDHSFDPGSGIATSPGFGNPVVYSLALDDNGKILVGGNFQLYNGTSVTGLVRINSDGSRDNSFQTGSGPTFLNVAGSGLVESILLQPNGKILAAGRFTHFDGTNRVGVVRLESNGAVDASFASGNIIGTGADMGTAHVWSQQIQADGKIILCGFFGYGTSSGDCITRLNPDGSADPSFIPGTGLDAFGLNEQIYSSCLLSTGKLMIAGNFTSYNQQSVNRVARISTTCELSVTPTVSIAITGGFNPVPCIGGSISFTATPTSGGASPAYVWKLNGVSTGITTATYTNSAFVDGDVITCEMTSSNPCAVPLTVTSNSILVSVGQPQTWYQDEDLDGYYTGTPIVSCYYPGPGYYNETLGDIILGGNDCDDQQSQIHPDAEEIPGNGIDENCNGLTDEPCTPTVGQNCYQYIESVTIGNMINANNGCHNSYSDYSGTLSVFAQPGTNLAYAFSCIEGSLNQQVNVYIDFNHNGSFDDAGEMVVQAALMQYGSPASGSIALPSDLANGLYRLRIVSEYDQFPAPTACFTSFGEVEDYTLDVRDVLPNCVPSIDLPCNTVKISEVILRRQVNGVYQNPQVLNYTPCDQYTDYSAEQYIRMLAGEILSLQIGTNIPATQWVNVYIDFNNNGYYDDPGEEIMADVSMEMGMPAFFNYTLPADLANGDYRIRILAHPVNTSANPCYVTEGEVEDYRLKIGSCDAFSANLQLAAGSPSQICNGQTTILQIRVPSPTTNLYSYTYGDGVNSFSGSAGANMGEDLSIPAFVNPTSTTTYYLLSVEDLHNCPATLSGSVTIEVGALNIQPSALVTQPTCSVSTGTISITPVSGTGYSYSIGGAYQSSPVFSNVSPGIYALSIQSGSGCFSDQPASVQINPAPLPPATPGVVTGPVNVCAFVGTATQIGYKVSSDPNATGYQWTVPPSVSIINGQGTDSITVQILVSFVSNANKVIKVKALGVCGNSSEKLLYLLAQMPSTPAPIVASGTNICSNLGTNVPITYFINRVAGASQYVWTVNSSFATISHPNGTGLNDTLVQVRFLTGFAGAVLSVQALNDCGSSGSRSISINRNNPTTPGLINGPVNACSYQSPGGLLAVYSVAANPDIVQYTWSVPAGVVGLTGQGTNSISFRYPAGFSSGTISVAASNGCGSSGNRSLNVSSLNPGTPGSIDVINISACPNQQYQYAVSGMPPNAASLQWTVQGGSIISGQGTASILVSFPTSGVNGSVSVQAVNSCAVSVVRSLKVKLPACPPALTAGKSALEIRKSTSGMVWPNPSNTSFQLQIPQTTTMVRILVTDETGRMVETINSRPAALLEIGSSWKPGIYFIRIVSNGTEQVEKLIKF